MHHLRFVAAAHCPRSLHFLHRTASIAAAFLAVFAVRADLQADATLHEGFSDANYTIGAPINGLNGGSGPFEGPWLDVRNDPGEEDTIAAGLSYTSPSSATLLVSGNALALSGNSPDYNFSDVARDFTAVPGVIGTSVWFSFLMRKDASSGALADAGMLKLFPTGNAIEIAIGDISASGRLALQLVTVPTVNAISTTTIVTNVVYLLVGRINYAGSATDSVELYANPEPGSASPGAPIATLKNLNFPGLKSARFSTGNQSAGARYTFDELRIGDTFADVTPAPEPGSAMLLFMAAGILGAQRLQRSPR